MKMSSISNAKAVKAVFLDVDGVLTDGSIFLDSAGKEIKRFDVQDGLGISALVRSGMLVFIVSSRQSKAVYHRAKELGITALYQGPQPKNDIIRDFLNRYRLVPEEAAFIGDDLVDLPAMNFVGFPVAVANARNEVKKAAAFITRAQGGHGAVREVIEVILKAQGKWKKLVRHYENPLKNKLVKKPTNKSNHLHSVNNAKGAS
jgi:3-deoxy-D-manno-octulosonate 8-phosphate phosphatase (KDO 8-P phosphatase)